MSNQKRAVHLKALNLATSYGQWRDAAWELDRLEGAEAWRQQEESTDYDSLLIRKRLTQFRELRRRGGVRELTFYLSEGLHGNLGNIANPRLYGYARTGTKALIEEYVDEVARCLEYICVGEFPNYSVAEKNILFKRAGHGFGRSAIMLSGGATLGMFHLGVIKALFEQNLLPKVLSGSSAGSLVAAMVATRTDAQLPQIFDAEWMQLGAFQRRSVANVMRGATLMDTQVLADCIQKFVGDESFEQAFERTRRILCITVSPAEPNQPPRLLNYLTAPHVLIKKAVQASCAIPGVFDPVMLQAVDFNGTVLPYMRSQRWIDGTLSNDMPILRLARLHNVNHFIVSQTNPHVVPFMRDNVGHGRGLRQVTESIVKNASRDVLKVARGYMGKHPGTRVVDKISDVLQQRYSGDVTIFPNQSSRNLMRMLSNPNPSEIRQYVLEGERATWPKLPRIRVQTRISRTFEDALMSLKGQLPLPSILDVSTETGLNPQLPA